MLFAYSVIMLKLLKMQLLHPVNGMVLIYEIKPQEFRFRIKVAMPRKIQGLGYSLSLTWISPSPVIWPNSHSWSQKLLFDKLANCYSQIKIHSSVLKCNSRQTSKYSIQVSFRNIQTQSAWYCHPAVYAIYLQCYHATDPSYMTTYSVIMLKLLKVQPLNPVNDMVLIYEIKP